MRLPAAFISALLLLLPPGAAPAAEEAEAAYARFHRAAVSGSLDEMVRHGPASQRAEHAAMSAAQKAAAVKMMAALLPRAYLLHHKTMTPDGQGARLIVSGNAEVQPGDKPETLYGTIRMAMERGEWKVAGMDWSNNRPAGLAEVRPAGKAAAPAPKAQAATAPRGAATAVGTPVERKLGTARPPCVYKPVMTAEDMEACR